MHNLQRFACCPRTYASALSCVQYVIMFNARYVLVRRTLLRCGMVGSSMRTAIRQGRLGHVLVVARSRGAYRQWIDRVEGPKGLRAGVDPAFSPRQYAYQPHHLTLAP